jgi:hypothetical protein
MIERCLHGELFGEPCTRDTPIGECCDPCARRRLLGDVARLGDAVENAFIAGYAQGWEDRTGRHDYADLDRLVAYLHPGQVG